MLTLIYYFESGGFDKSIHVAQFHFHTPPLKNIRTIPLTDSNLQRVIANLRSAMQLCQSLSQLWFYTMFPASTDIFGRHFEKPIMLPIPLTDSNLQRIITNLRSAVQLCSPLSQLWFYTTFPASTDLFSADILRNRLHYLSSFKQGSYKASSQLVKKVKQLAAKSYFSLGW